MTFLKMNITQIQATAGLIKSIIDTNHQAFQDLSKNQLSLKNWQGAGAILFAQQFSQIYQEFERQNQVFTSYQLILNNYLCQTHLETENVNLLLSNQLK